MSDQTHYKGIELDTKLLDAANSMLDGQGDGRISKADAKKLLALISEDGVATNAEKATFAYILETFNWTPAARKLVQENDALQLSSFAPETIKANDENQAEQTETESGTDEFTPPPAIKHQICHGFFGGLLNVCAHGVGEAIEVDAILLNKQVGAGMVSMYNPHCQFSGNNALFSVDINAALDAEIDELFIDVVLTNPIMGKKHESAIMSF